MIVSDSNDGGGVGVDGGVMEKLVVDSELLTYAIPSQQCFVDAGETLCDFGLAQVAREIPRTIDTAAPQHLGSGVTAAPRPNVAASSSLSVSPGSLSLRSSAPDSDISAPRMDGIDLCRRFRDAAFVIRSEDARFEGGGRALEEDDDDDDDDGYDEGIDDDDDVDELLGSSFPLEPAFPRPDQEFHRINIFNDLPDLLRDNYDQCVERIVPKVLEVLSTSSSPRAHQAAAAAFLKILRQRSIPPEVFAEAFLSTIVAGVESLDEDLEAVWTEGLLQILELLPSSLVHDSILPIVVSKSHLSRPPSSRLSASRLLGKISAGLDDPSLLRREILPSVQSLCQDSDHRVRASASRQLSPIARGLDSDSIVSSVLPELVELTKDAEKGVRIAGIETVADILDLFDGDVSRQTLAPLAVKFFESGLEAEDSSLPLIVRQIGKVTHGLSQHLTPGQVIRFLDLFCRMCHLGSRPSPRRRRRHSDVAVSPDDEFLRLRLSPFRNGRAGVRNPGVVIAGFERDSTPLERTSSSDASTKELSPDDVLSPGSNLDSPGTDSASSSPGSGPASPGCNSVDSDSRLRRKLESLNSMEKEETMIRCRLNAAFNFPAMASLFETAAAKHGCAAATPFPASAARLRRALTSLCRDPRAEVRRKIAAGFHEVAARLPVDDEDGDDDDAVSIFDSLVHLLFDESLGVLKSLVENMDATLLALADRCRVDRADDDDDHDEENDDQRRRRLLRQRLFASLVQSWDTAYYSYDWRLQAQIFDKWGASLSRWFSSDQIFFNIVPFLFEKIRDLRPIPARLSACRCLLRLARQIRRSEQRSQIRDRIVKDFCGGRSSADRLLFLEMLSLMLPLFSRRYIKENFFGAFLLLGADPVLGVRLKFVRLLPEIKDLLSLPADEALAVALESSVDSLASSLPSSSSLEESLRDFLLSSLSSSSADEEVDGSSLDRAKAEIDAENLRFERQLQEEEAAALERRNKELALIGYSVEVTPVEGSWIRSQGSSRKTSLRIEESDDKERTVPVASLTEGGEPESSLNPLKPAEISTDNFNENSSKNDAETFTDDSIKNRDENKKLSENITLDPLSASENSPSTQPASTLSSPSHLPLSSSKSSKLPVHRPSPPPDLPSTSGLRSKLPKMSSSSSPRLSGIRPSPPPGLPLKCTSPPPQSPRHPPPPQRNASPKALTRAARFVVRAPSPFPLRRKKNEVEGNEVEVAEKDVTSFVSKDAAAAATSEATAESPRKTPSSKPPSGASTTGAKTKAPFSKSASSSIKSPPSGVPRKIPASSSPQAVASPTKSTAQRNAPRCLPPSPRNASSSSYSSSSSSSSGSRSVPSSPTKSKPPILSSSSFSSKTRPNSSSKTTRPSTISSIRSSGLRPPSPRPPVLTKAGAGAAKSTPPPPRKSGFVVKTAPSTRKVEETEKVADVKSPPFSAASSSKVEETATKNSARRSNLKPPSSSTSASSSKPPSFNSSKLPQRLAAPSFKGSSSSSSSTAAASTRGSNLPRMLKASSSEPSLARQPVGAADSVDPAPRVDVDSGLGAARRSNLAREKSSSGGCLSAAGRKNMI